MGVLAGEGFGEGNGLCCVRAVYGTIMGCIADIIKEQRDLHTLAYN